MKYFLSLPLLFLLSACSAIHVVPQQSSDSSGTIENNRILQQKADISVALQMRDLMVRPAPVETNICSFWVEIDNQRGVKLPVSYRDFTLVDSTGQQYQAYEPEKLLTLTEPSVPYLIPYPYVGYYYLEDAYTAQAQDQHRSEATYFSSRRAEHIVLDGLADQALLPGSKAAGAIYFPADLRTMAGFQVHYQVQALPGQQSFPLSFFFSVEKN